MKHTSIVLAAFGLLSLCPLPASAYYCTKLNYSGAKVLPNAEHQYILKGICMAESEHAIETATLTWSDTGQVTEEFLLTFDAHKALKYRTIVTYSCSGGDPWQTSQATCQRIACVSDEYHGQWMGKHGCSPNKLGTALPMTRGLVPALAKYTSDDPLDFAFSPKNKQEVPAGGKAQLSLLLQKNAGANLSPWADGQGKYYVTANLYWMEPDGVFKTKQSALPKFSKLYRHEENNVLYNVYEGTIDVDSKSFPVPGVWTVKACIDQDGFKGCTDHKILVAKQPPNKPLSGDAPATVHQSLGAVAPPPGGAGRAGGGFAPTQRPVTGTLPQRETAAVTAPETRQVNPMVVLKPRVPPSPCKDSRAATFPPSPCTGAANTVIPHPASAAAIPQRSSEPRYKSDTRSLAGRSALRSAPQTRTGATPLVQTPGEPAVPQRALSVGNPLPVAQHIECSLKHKSGGWGFTIWLISVRNTFISTLPVGSQIAWKVRKKTTTSSGGDLFTRDGKVRNPQHTVYTLRQGTETLIAPLASGQRLALMIDKVATGFTVSYTDCSVSATVGKGG